MGSGVKRDLSDLGHVNILKSEFLYLQSRNISCHMALCGFLLPTESLKGKVIRCGPCLTCRFIFTLKYFQFHEYMRCVVYAELCLDSLSYTSPDPSDSANYYLSPILQVELRCLCLWEAKLGNTPFPTVETVLLTTIFSAVT